mgnify:CR=1 FL=1
MGFLKKPFGAISTSKKVACDQPQETQLPEVSPEENGNQTA